jgi:Uma2 family endonuclease
MLECIDELPEVRDLVTEDDTPVDNLPSEKQQRLLTEPLYSSWTGPGDGRPFLAAANVGIFFMLRSPPVVPDMFLSLDVDVAEDWWRKDHRSYFLWEFGKPPDLALEIVSNTEGGEAAEKKRKYERMRVTYYVIYDPLRQVMPDALTIYHLHDAVYQRQDSALLDRLGLGLTLWNGSFESKHDTWLRWTDAEGELIPSGKERAEEEHQRAEAEHLRAEDEHLRAEQERLRADEERLRAGEEHQRAEAERRRADGESRRAEQAESQLAEERRRVEQLMALLRGAGLEPGSE